MGKDRNPGVGIPPAASDDWGVVEWAVDASGKVPAREFFLALSPADRAKIQALFNRLAKQGRIDTRERFKKLETVGGWALWEFKSFQLRFIGAFSRTLKAFVVAEGVRKKQNRHRPRDLDRAARILAAHFRASNRGKRDGGRRTGGRVH